MELNLESYEQTIGDGGVNLILMCMGCKRLLAFGDYNFGKFVQSPFDQDRYGCRSCMEREKLNYVRS